MTWQKNSTSNLELRTVCPPRIVPLLFLVLSISAFNFSHHLTTSLRNHGRPRLFLSPLCVTPSKFSSPSLLTVTYVFVNFTFLLCLFVAVNCCYDDSWYTSCVREVPQLLHMPVSCKVNFAPRLFSHLQRCLGRRYPGADRCLVDTLLCTALCCSKRYTTTKRMRRLPE